ncbi:uncharacterized protein LOC131621788 [Vicia villosa]|uniref:uncharacterized protein LOC131621788 n=1 Tax=Vicia villosa TaxID=3911 RepID=UPI00273B3B35|nr:uncharacterized protein LOC131621788 [Vicia villosa]
METAQKFAMMQTYELLIDDNNRIDWYYMIAHNFARPRAKVFMWLICQNRLATKVRMKNMGLLQHTTCQLCNKDEEDLDHLMFKCPATAHIWMDMKRWLNIDQNQHIHLDWLKRMAKGKGWKNQFVKAAATEACYGIWMYRNSTIFDNKGSYSDIHRITRNVCDSIVYRGWRKPKLRKHIVNILM